MKKRLLFIISQMYRGGAETSLVNLLNNLDPIKVEVDLLIFNQCPVKDAESILDEIPSWINIYDAYKHFSRRKKISNKLNNIMYSNEDREHCYFEALNFLRNKTYDWAFNVGEWYKPHLISMHVSAKNKCAWIHNDISRAEYFNADEYFRYHEYIDYYLFVSQNSLVESCKMYPFLEEKALTIYNINDVNKIKKQANEPISEYKVKKDMPILLTVANFRKQKNHLRQIKVMKKLWDRGLKFRWINIGALTDNSIVNNVKELAKQYELDEYFQILGPQKNPYKFINNSDAVAVLSDYESWSMVITEAKILGKPVISTKTSGALEQIEHNMTGILADFEEECIIDEIYKYLTDIKLQNKIKNNIKNFDNTNEILQSFYDLIDRESVVKNTISNKILYIIDDINYLGGAHVATKLQIKELLKNGQDITVFSNIAPNANVRSEMLGVKFKNWEDIEINQLYNRRILNCLLDKTLDKESKKIKIKLTYESKVKKIDVFSKYVKEKCIDLFSEYETVCVMSEGSFFKKEVAKSKCKHKIQWIHTDYCSWKDKDDYARYVSKNDKEIWKLYDDIVVLTENIKDSFCKLYPHLSSKVSVFKNLMPVEKIKQKKGPVLDKDVLEFVTVGRVDSSKAYKRLIKILQRLNDEGEKFTWTIVGDGSEYWEIKKLVESSTLENNIFMVGAQSNPFKFIAKADIFALMSDYEGLPNTIYEALILGKPVVATNVGGIKTQIIENKTGWLAENNDNDIYRLLKYLLNNRDKVDEVKENVKNYEYDNKSILNKTYNLFIK